MKVFKRFLKLKLREIGITLLVLSGVVTFLYIYCNVVLFFTNYGDSNYIIEARHIISLIIFSIALVFLVIYGLYRWIKSNWRKAKEQIKMEAKNVNSK